MRKEGNEGGGKEGFEEGRMKESSMERLGVLEGKFNEIMDRLDVFGGEFNEKMERLGCTCRKVY